MIILKFGGSSVKTADRISQVMDILSSRVKQGEEIAVVFSALGGATDLLIDMAGLAANGDEKYLALFNEFKERHDRTTKELLLDGYTEVQEILNRNHEILKSLLKGIFLVREASPRTMDYVQSFGERNSAFIISEALKKKGMPAEYLDARKIITTDSDFTSAKVDFSITIKSIKAYFKERKGTVQIVTGFIAAAEGGLTTTLGRGGSDYTAAIIAGALKVKALEIWTDVDGVLTCDPRKVSEAFTLSELSYAEAMEMSHFGAKVIYPPTIQPALKENIPIYIRNTFNPSFEGTKIHNDPDTNYRSTIKGISSLRDISMITLQGSGMLGIPGISARLFSVLGREKINIVLITQASSEHSITFAVSDSDMEDAKKKIEEEFRAELDRGDIDPVNIVVDMVIIAVIGENMKSVPGVAGNLFQSLGHNDINIVAIAQGSSELNISFVISKQDEVKALNVLHEKFFESDLTQVHVYALGVGLIGGTLLEQIGDQKEYLADHLGLDIKVVAVSNSSMMLYEPKGITLDQWIGDLHDSAQPADINGFIDHMIGQNRRNSVFVDNTASKRVPTHYKKILQAGISIVTPNKVATSSSYESYLNLKKLASKHGVKFLYETNVGAGLPILSTIEGLVNSGDQIVKIEAVLSGSLSYIFNNFDGSTPFSKLVAKAKELGYTEPDPREDLSGADVSRKIVILTREAGIEIEPSDVSLSPLLPSSCTKVDSVKAFFDVLETENHYFEKLLESAKAENKVLRYIAVTENGKASISLQSVGLDSPFYNLAGSDNMVVITTTRYDSRPLVVSGPGAGAEVTAGGVFADIIKVVS